MRSSSYYIGFLLADWIVFTVPQIMLAIMVFVLNLEEFKKSMFVFFLTIELFALPFISLIYCFSFIFDKAEASYKFIILVFLAIYIIPLLLVSLIDSDAILKIMDIISPVQTLISQLGDILDTSSAVEIAPADPEAPEPVVDGRTQA